MLVFRVFHSIRTVLFFVLFLALIPAFIIILYTGNEHIKLLKADARENTLRQIETLAEIQNRITSFTRQTLITIAGLPMVRDLDPAVAASILNAAREANPDYINFTIIDLQGRVVSSALLAGGENLSDRKSFRDALATRGFGAGEYVISRALKEPSFNFAHAIFDANGKMTGAVGTIYRLSIYSALMDNMRLPKGSVLGITDHRGLRLFFHPSMDTNPIGKPIKSEMWKILQRGDDSGTSDIEGSDGIRRIYAFKKLRLSPPEDPYMYFVLGVPEAAVMASSKSVQERNMVLLLSALLFAVALAWVFSEVAFARKLKAVIGATHLLQGGEFSARTGVAADGTDIGKVADALDRMAEVMQHREKERNEAAKALENSLEEKETLLREIHHRVKNNLQVILSLVRLQGNTGGSAAEFSQLMETRISAMSLVHEMLYRSEDLSRVDIASYMEHLADLVLRGADNPSSIDISIDAEPLSFSLERAIPFALALNELLANAMKHSLTVKGGCRIVVSLHDRGGTCILRVEDDGPGLPPGFNPEETEGLGMQLVRGLVIQLHGTLRWENAGGAVFIIQFPVSG